MIGYGISGSRISTRNLGLVHESTVEIAKALKKVGAENYCADEVLVKLRQADMPAAQFTSEYAAEVGKLDVPMGSGRLIQMSLTPVLSLPEALALLAADPRIEYAELNTVVQLTAEGAKSKQGESEPPVRIAIEPNAVAIGDCKLNRRLAPLC